MSISNPRKQHQHQGAGSRLAALHEGTRYEKRFSVLRCQAKPLGFHRAIISHAPVLPTTRRHGSRTCCSASGRLRGFYTSAAPFFLCYSCFSCIKSSSHLGRLTLIFFFHPAFAARSRRFSFLSGDSLSDGCEQKRASISCRFRNCFAVLPRLIPTLVIRHPRYFFSAGNKNTNCWDSPFSLFSFPPLRHPFRLFR